MDNNHITAEEARSLTKESKNFKKHLYQDIIYTAKEGKCSLEYGVDGLDDEVLKKVKKELKEKGYNISDVDDEAELNKVIGLKISW